MRKFFGILCLVLFLTAGFGFGQEAQQNQEQSQPAPAPFFVLFGNQWVYYGNPQLIQSFDDLGAQLYVVLLRDQNGMGGFVELIYIVKENKAVLVCGWIKPYSSEEQGFVLMDENSNFQWFLMQEKKVNGEQLEWRGLEDQEGNPIMTFYVKKKDGSEIKVRDIDIKKFVEKNFKDQN